MGSARDQQLLAVGEVAALAGVSVRTLHHYDAIGLLTPSGRSAGGYRLYATDDVARLQRILGYRELGFSLEHTAELLDDPRTDVPDHLRRQRQELSARIDRLRRIVAAIDLALEAHEMNIRLTPQEMVEVFGETSPTEHAAEAERRWGETPAWQESQRRVGRYDKQQWLAIRAEAESVEARYRELFTAGVPAGAPEALEAARRHRDHISRWFYECSPEMHRGLGEMYLADERFRAHYDEQVAGLAEWVSGAVCAAADADTRS